METLKKLIDINIKHCFLLMKAKKKFKTMKNCGVKSEEYDEKYTNIKFNSDGELPPKKKQ